LTCPTTEDMSSVVFPLVFSAVAIVGLIGWLVVIKRREARTRRNVSTHPSRSPVLVDRPYDPTLCDFCDEKRSVGCPACERPLCALHAPWRAGLFCALCENEWETGARRRALIIVPLTAIAMMAAAGVTVAIMELTSFRPGMGLLLVWLGCGAPFYLGIERRMRRLFRRRGQLSRARQVRP